MIAVYPEQWFIYCIFTYNTLPQELSHESIRRDERRPIILPGHINIIEIVRGIFRNEKSLCCNEC